MKTANEVTRNRYCNEVQLVFQVKAKTELLLSAEASKAAQRADLQNHLDTAQHALQDKQQVMRNTQT